jgi:exodeoxyribonuclease VII small subunit
MSESSDKPRRFEQIVEDLQALVARLEAGNLPLDEALDLYERGVALAREGNRQLEGAERRVEELQKSLAAGD